MIESPIFTNVICLILGVIIERIFRVLDKVKWEIKMTRDTGFWKRQGFVKGDDGQWSRDSLRVANMREVPENELLFRQLEGLVKYRTRYFRLIIVSYQQDGGKTYLMHQQLS